MSQQAESTPPRWRQNKSQNTFLTKFLTEPISNQIQAVGSMLLVLIALLYTVPLGLWENFWKSDEIEVRRIRQAITDLADIDAKTFLGVAQIQDPVLISGYLGSINVMRISILERERERIEKLARRQKLAVPELYNLAIQFQRADRLQLALEMVEAAFNQVSDKGFGAIMQADLFRMRGQLNFLMYGSEINVDQIRSDYGQALGLLPHNAATSSAALNLFQLLEELAFIEAMLERGDWSCATKLVRFIEKKSSILKFFPEPATRRFSTTGERFQKLQRKDSQTEHGCHPSIEKQLKRLSDSSGI